MTKLEDRQMQMLKLIGRTPPDADGWRPVSDMCASLFERKPDLPPPELFEFERLASGGRVRLTERGDILLAYS